MKRSSSSLGSNDERRKELHKDDHNNQPHSRLEEERQRRRRQWLIQQEREREHERLKQKMILEYELKRAREKDASHSRGRLVEENNRKSRTRDRSLEIVCIKNAKTTSSKSPAIPGKSDTACGSTSLFKGPEGTQISEKELHCIKVDIHRNIPVKGQISELQRDIINPEDVIIIRRSGEGSKPIFEREEIKSTSKKIGEIEERRTVIAVESGDSVNRSESFRRRSPSSNSLRHHQRSSSYRRSKSKDSKDSSCKFDYRTSRKSDRRQSRERSRERRKKYKEHDRLSSRYRSFRNRESPSQEYREHRRDSYSGQDFRHKNESRKEEGGSSSSKPRNRSTSNRERERRSRSRSRSHSRSRDNRYGERQMMPSHCIDQVPYPVYYGPRPMMVGPMMPLRGQIPIARGRIPPSVMGPIRPFPPRFIPPNVYRLGPPPNYRFGPMF